MSYKNELVARLFTIKMKWLKQADSFNFKCCFYMLSIPCLYCVVFVVGVGIIVSKQPQETPPEIIILYLCMAAAPLTCSYLILLCMWLGNNVVGLLTTHSIRYSRSVLDGTCVCVCLLKIGILSVMEFTCSGLVLLSVICKINA